MASPLTTFVVLLVLAFGPSLLYLRWFRNMEQHDPEPVRKVLRAFIWGAIGSIFWVTIINLSIFAGVGGYLETEYEETETDDPAVGVVGFVIVVVLMAPVIEEAVKVWGVSSRAGIRDEIDEIEDGMIYGAAIGLGFAATENLLYGYMALDEAGTAAAIATVMVRAISSTLLHTSASAIAGYGVGRVLVAGDPKRVQYSYYLVAVGLHATFNGAAVVGEVMGGDGTSLLSFFFVLGLAWFATDFVRRRIHELDDLQGGVVGPQTAYGNHPGYGRGGGYPGGHGGGFGGYGSHGGYNGYGQPEGHGRGHPHHRPPPPHTTGSHERYPYTGHERRHERHPRSAGHPPRGSSPHSAPASRSAPHPRSVAQPSKPSKPTGTRPAPTPKPGSGHPSTGQPGTEAVVLELQGPGKRQTRVKVPTSLPLYQLLESARSHYQLPPHRYRLRSSGKYLPFNKTVGQVGLRSHDVVDIIAPG